MIRSHQEMMTAGGMRSVSEAHLQQLLKRQALRRLFKARHQEMDHMEIRTKTLCASLKNDPNTPFTVYSLQIRSKLRYGDCGSWVLKKRYSEFFNFRKQMLHQIELFDSLICQKCPQNEKRASKNELEVLSNCLRRCMSNDFPRKHMRCDTEKILLERRRGLQDFVRKLLDTYVDLSVYLVERQFDQPPTKPVQVLKDIFAGLEEFLDFPPEQKDLEKRHTAAILALQEVEDQAEDIDHDSVAERASSVSLTSKERMCCICLDDLDDEEVASPEARDSCSSRHENHLVKLPCGHHFHEDCVIDWFTASTTCPLCRQPAISSEEAMSSFDVSLH